MMEGPMLKGRSRWSCRVLRKRGRSIRELARLTGTRANMVRCYLRGGDAQGGAEAGRAPAAALFREIKVRGYTGGETRLKQFVRGLAPVPASPRIACFETEPVHQIRADWATAGRDADKLKVFIATPGVEPAAFSQRATIEDTTRPPASTLHPPVGVEERESASPAGGLVTSCPQQMLRTRRGGSPTRTLSWK
jgi:transposase